LVVESENGAQPGQFLPDLQAHSRAMGQKAGEKWTAAPHLQPTIPKPDRLLGVRRARLSRLDIQGIALRQAVGFKSLQNQLGILLK
jgi:hypothetical protein